MNQRETVVGKLSIIDRFIPIWIFLTMALGVGLGVRIPRNRLYF